MIAFAEERRIAVPGGEIWAGVCGDLSASVPLLAIHGGPGMSHDYLEPLAELADGRAVIFYDQLDAGRSERPGEPGHWRVDRFLAEIDAVRGAFGLARVAVFGNSWGGTLAAAYAATQPEGLTRLVLSSPLIATADWLADAAALRAALPADVRATLDRCEAAGETGGEAYAAATDLFYRRHLCRSDPWPDCLERTLAAMNPICYGGMWGPNEFTCTGVLRDYDGQTGLAEIAVPVLVTCGRHDEARPGTCRRWAEQIPDARLEVFEEASHTAFLEVPRPYLAALRGFLAGS